MIGERLKQLIDINGITQSHFAKQMQISPSRLSNYLSNKREPDLELLAKMAMCLGVDLNYFFPDFFEVVEKEAEQRCRVCGCTYHNACPGGCYWEEEDLCSECVGAYEALNAMKEEARLSIEIVGLHVDLRDVGLLVSQHQEWADKIKVKLKETGTSIEKANKKWLEKVFKED